MSAFWSLQCSSVPGPQTFTVAVGVPASSSGESQRGGTQPCGPWADPWALARQSRLQSPVPVGRGAQGLVFSTDVAIGTEDRYQHGVAYSSLFYLEGHEVFSEILRLLLLAAEEWGWVRATCWPEGPSVLAVDGTQLGAGGTCRGWACGPCRHGGPAGPQTSPRHACAFVLRPLGQSPLPTVCSWD